MSCLEKLPHSCGSSDGLQVFQDEEGNVSGFCFACSTYVPDPYGEGVSPPTLAKREKTEEEKMAEMSEALSLPILAQEHRGLTEETAEYFGVRTAYSEEDGVTPTAWFFPYYLEGKLKGFKVKTLDKKIWNIGETKGMEPFGYHLAMAQGNKTLFIVEGEEDAEALFQILKMTSDPKFTYINPSVISIRAGASNPVKQLAPFLTDIQRAFKSVVLVLDNDEVGRKATNEILKVAPWMTSAELPEKDANACLLAGKLKAAQRAVLWGSKKKKNTKLINGASLVEKAKTPPQFGRPWPFPSLTRITRGRRDGEVYYFGAGVKMGKSELVDELGNAFMLEDGNPVLFVKPEQDPADTMQRLVGKAASSIFYDPERPFDEEAFDRGAELVGRKAIILDSYQFINWDTLKGDIAEAVTTEGVKDVIIDPITCFTNELTDSDANVELRRIASELALMAKDLQFCGYVFCHLLAPKVGKPHERGGKVESTQFAGSRAMMR